MENRYVLDQECYAACARKAAADGAVLLRNERQALPLRQGERVAVFGRAQLHYYKSGTGSGGLVNTRYVWSILDALKAEKELTVDPELEQTYRAWDAAHPVAGEGGWGREAWNCEEMPLPDDAVERAAGKNSAALVLIGRTAGEDRDAADAEGSYQLTQAERDMLQKVCARTPEVRRFSIIRWRIPVSCSPKNGFLQDRKILHGKNTTQACRISI